MATIRERITEYFGLVSKHELETVKAEARRAYEAGYNDSANDEPASGDLKSFGYKRVTTAGLRDFHKMPFDKALETIWTLWQSSPIAKRVIKIKRGYVIGKGLTPVASEEDLQTILTDFWDRNNLDADGRRANEFTEQLFLFGEQCFPVFVQESAGAVSLGYFDPGEIEDVIHNPENALETCAVVLKAGTANGSNPWEKDRPKRVYRLVRESQAGETKGRLVTWKQAEKSAQIEAWEKTMLEAHGLAEYSGDVLFTQINKVSNQERGYSDLLQVADAIDMADQVLFALATREQIASYFFVDVTVEGDDNDIAKTVKRIGRKPPKPHGANVHNKAETWQIMQPDLKQEGSISTLVALLTFIMGGMGFPVSWYGYGADTNRATLEAQGDPTYRQLEDDQGVIRSMFLRMLTFARDQAILAGNWTPKEKTDEVILLPMPEMTAKDFSRVLGLFTPLVSAMLQLRDSRLLTDETLLEAIGKVLKEMDIEFSVEEELADLEEDELETVQANNDKLAGMLATAKQNGANGTVKAPMEN